MWCPLCNHTETRVVDSRLTRDGMQIRRRRECSRCNNRFNTFETPELKAPRVIKSGGNREAFSEHKLRQGMLKALEKRPVETREVERAIRGLVREISSVEEAEIPASLIGEWVMRELSRLDQVAYVRFASVYKRFEDVQAFRDLIERLEREHPGGLDQRQISLLDQPAGRKRQGK
ncbi:MAG: transcriptional repressor NrdR [Xanthomonadales bacterium]|nr:transcriptional repressor NrdR [Xanthomonadales bacterium]NIN59760.1 transcriptional repressor NrdR [Xanthomonadales bacterium]NIN75529.1 transcriptional repressor NrdR [Xanthomonadales bacterium]NIO15218.1 transcriptional repressor NrdR [Xanthomonadales bacterium]NIP12153.1 transcriptional repressor NrdR [Xanthomonadales bacterium]